VVEVLDVGMEVVVVRSVLVGVFGTDVVCFSVELSVGGLRFVG
jgi:hypothetical protein